MHSTDIFEEIVSARQEGRPVVLATVVETQGSGPRGQGARLLVKKDGQIVGTVGGGALEKRVIEEALGMMHSAEPKLLDYNLQDIGMSCGGRMRVFLEPLNPSPRLIIFGAGHIGQVLSRLVKTLEFHVTVVDNRPDFADPERLPWADRVIAGQYAEALETLAFDSHTFVVVLTHRHAHDQEVVSACVRKPYRYLGMIGSRRKVGQVLAALREQGVSEAILQSIHAPIGLDIAANTPAEIAVSIAAELVAVKNQGKKESSGCSTAG